MLIDAQVNMFDPSAPVVGSDVLIDRFSSLLQWARASHLPIVFVRNCGPAGAPDERGTPGWELHPTLQPAVGDLVLDKTTCNTFASTPLASELSARGVREIILAGLQSEYCVLETSLGALNQNLDVTLVADGHSTYDGGGRAARDVTAAVNGVLGARLNLKSADEIRRG